MHCWLWLVGVGVTLGGIIIYILREYDKMLKERMEQEIWRAAVIQELKERGLWLDAITYPRRMD